MFQYEIIFTPEATDDINQLTHYIENELMLPQTAQSYIAGIYGTIGKISFVGGAISQREYIQMLYGPNARTAIYKKMTIVFNIIDDVVLIRRIMPGSMVL
ncbi:hypothetical protein AGMMS49982_05680 [Bacteroidia bacterium]|nr:hypothetical protein AGMMS49982_05680 [Bacteroidia bacterium]